MVVMADDQLHIFFFPMMAHGHIIPTLDMAKLFVSHGAKATIITTPLNLPIFMQSIEKLKHLGLEIYVKAIRFPAVEAGLPEGCERMDQLNSYDLVPKFFKATTMLQEQLELLLHECQPNALVADMFFPWATESAAKFDIPRLVFHGMGFFALCASENLRHYKPQKNVCSDTEPFVVPNLPHKVKLTRMKLAPYDREETEMTKFIEQVKESESTSFGVIVNSFYELEPDYADYYRKVLGKRAWHIGPILLCNRKNEEKFHKSIDHKQHECLQWLDTRKHNSVIYVCFGSMSNFTDSQIEEIALGLEASEQEFIWVVRKGKIPEGFEERTKEKGLIIRGWAPQVLILDHEAIGAFVTHCGWNSTLESVSAGVPMVTWPMFAEQFFNEQLITKVLKIGVAVGAEEWSIVVDNVKSEAITKAVKRVMVGEESKEMRRRAKEVKKMANKAVEEGGSSYSDLNALFQELRTINLHI
ncbi:scopoletin glucosyltransferase-like [Solanum verrucosum]|uniref:scopoletin glucosyltransferase-like n=1 Tax=Solanum verrucosum TaxID=315347 RepID=UPI0020D02075|nr:scopoletin glucosyltransferase-like [Solanum verrucosum]